MLDYELKHAGDTALVVEFGERVDRNVSARVVALANAIGSLDAPGVLEVIPTFRSLMIRYEPVLIDAEDLSALVARALALSEEAKTSSRRWVIPACFEGEFAPDADDVCVAAGVARADLTDALSSSVYHVYMLGFLPGQPYLGDLPDPFDLPRRRSPRTSVPAGSIGIAKRLVCVYPAQTPCGWHIVGRCAARLWTEEGPLLQAGDEVRLSPVPARDFDPDAFALPLLDARPS